MPSFVINPGEQKLHVTMPMPMSTKPNHARIKNARLQKKLSQEDAATALGLSQGFLSRLETGTREPTVDVIEKMAELYGVPEEYFFAALPAEAVAGRKPKSTLDLSIREQIMLDTSATAGLRSLAADDVMAANLGITDQEWRDLRSCCNLSFQPTKAGYIQLLTALRGIERA